MRSSPPLRLEKSRITTGRYRTKSADGMNGAFFLRAKATGNWLNIIASDGAHWEEAGLAPPVWEHVSVSTETRCPTYSEMDEVKRLFWRDDECVMQLHVPRTEHVNRHRYCLHLWRPVGLAIPQPPVATVG